MHASNLLLIGVKPLNFRQTDISVEYIIRDRSLNMGGGGPEDFQGGPPIFSQASKGGPLSFSRGQ